MATAQFPSLRNSKDNYELELSRMKERIKTEFVELIGCLKARENELLRELDNIRTYYTSFKSDLEKVKNKISSLKRMKQQQEEELKSSPVKPLIERILNEINKELKSTETPKEPRMFTFECDSNKMLSELNKLGKFVEKISSGTDYISKKQPLVSVCERGKGIEQLNWPLGVKVDQKTGNIYIIADQHNHCVKVFDNNGNYLFKFGDNEGKEKIYCPNSLTICGNRILISQRNHCIINYQLNGKYISRIGREGNGELEFNNPFGLSIDELNEDIYICDHYNNRIQILNRDFSFKTQFGKDILKRPLDVKHSKQYIFVLDKSTPCLHLFNNKNILQKSVITRGKGMSVISPYFFTIDQTDNILISDHNSNFIHVFNNQFQKTHSISTSNSPMGITVDKEGRVIVVCQAVKNCLLIF